jgi:hypothetical protein
MNGVALCSGTAHRSLRSRLMSPEGLAKQPEDV